MRRMTCTLAVRCLSVPMSEIRSAIRGSIGTWSGLSGLIALLLDDDGLDLEGIGLDRLDRAVRGSHELGVALELLLVRRDLDQRGGVGAQEAELAVDDAQSGAHPALTVGIDLVGDVLHADL